MLEQQDVTEAKAAIVEELWGKYPQKLILNCFKRIMMCVSSTRKKLSLCC
jgi:hypothetical protein